jgi:serine protease AprX
MRRRARARILTSLAAGAAAVIALGLSAPTPASASTDLAAVSPYLSKQLTSLSGKTVVLVHGKSLADATRAVSASGLTKVVTFKKIGVVGARGTRAQIQSVRSQPGVTYVEAGAQPIRFFAETSNRATRGLEATQTLTGADGSALTGKGVSVGVIDSGVDPTHPYFKEADGSSAVVASYKTLCDPTESQCTVLKVPNSIDTDTLSLGGHGTHVNGIVAGRPTMVGGALQQGAAPGAKLVDLSTGAGLFIIGADAALNWVLENHNAPCGAGVSASTCPPIKVTNNSYGPTGGGAFDPSSATAKIQEALAAEGVVTVWANGNDGGDGSADLSNPPGKDPTGGIISVASYFDQDNGTRDGTVSDYSSRGKAGDQSTYPDISAPGENITSSCRIYLAICSSGLDPRNGPGALDIGTFNTISGTSMAAPHIAGIVAQLFQANPSATPAQVENALKTTAYKYAHGAAYESGPLGTTSFDKGYGLVDVVAAAAAVR